jgi:D-galactarolactone cycloisomerase
MAPEARITDVEARRYRFPLDPPFRAAWDPVPRTHQDATLVLVHSDSGVTGYASGDHLPDREVLAHFLVGLDPLRTEAVREICETVDFHGGRPWTVECAVWDLAGRLLDTPVWRLLGGRSERMLAYASSGELVDPDERARRALALRDHGVRALKLRFHHADWREDVAVVEHVREAVGDDFELMVDANQGWRMAGDRAARWDVATAARCARELERLGAYWLEEPLRCDDVEGYRALRALTGIRIAAGEMVRGAHEARDLILRGGVDVLQPDVVLSGGISGCRRLAALADLCGRMFSPHTWSNGYGLVCNLHLTLAVSTCPFVEVPYDPPAWSAERRDWLLPAVVEIAEDGTIAPPAGPGLGVTPDLDALERWRVA